METRPEHPGLAETIDLRSAEEPAGPSPGGTTDDGRSGSTYGSVPASPPVPIRDHDGVDLSAETRSLLKVRLRAAALIMLLGFGLFYLRNILAMEPLGVLSVMHAGVIAILAGSAWVLSRPRPLSMARLRAIEAAVFGGPLIFFAAMQYLVTSFQIGRGNELMEAALRPGAVLGPGQVAELVRSGAGMIATVKGSVIYVFMMMVIYGLLVPNPWRRAALGVGCFLLVGFLVQMLVILRSSGSGRYLKTIVDFEHVSTNFLIILIGAVVAIYGSYVINTLRVEAFEARRLGQYLLGERLGAGGMGEVYLAEHRLLKRPCAIKLIRPDRAGDPTALRRFEREVRSTARLSHWNTIEIYDYGRTEDGTFYYAMEYLRGLSLADLVARHGPLPPGRVVYLLRQACEALAEAHAEGLIHRDLKPANLFAARRGGQFDVTKVLDFGLVKPVDAAMGDAEATGEGTVTGSPLYMSPEQATGGPIDARSDLYSLGAVAYFLLTGRPPIDGRSAVQVLIAVARDPAVSPSRVRPGVPADLESVVLRCLAKPPAARYDSAEALARALGSCACSRDWDASRAAAWWREAEPLTAG